MAFCLSNGKDERDRKVKSLQEIINCSRGEADRLLTESDGNLSLACDKFFLANGTDIGGDKAKVRNDFNMINRNSVINHEKNFTSRLNEHRLLHSGDDHQTTNRYSSILTRMTPAMCETNDRNICYDWFLAEDTFTAMQEHAQDPYLKLFKIQSIIKIENPFLEHQFEITKQQRNHLQPFLSFYHSDSWDPAVVDENFPQWWEDQGICFRAEPTVTLRAAHTGLLLCVVLLDTAQSSARQEVLVRDTRRILPKFVLHLEKEEYSVSRSSTLTTGSLLKNGNKYVHDPSWDSLEHNEKSACNSGKLPKIFDEDASSQVEDGIERVNSCDKENNETAEMKTVRPKLKKRVEKRNKE